MNAAALAYLIQSRTGRRSRRSGRQWSCRCVAHDDHAPSMIIFDGHTGVQVRCLAGCDPRDIIAVLKDWGIWRDANGERRPVVQRREPIEKNAGGAELWGEAQYPGVLCGKYFASRGLELDEGIAERVIRFHPRCPFGPGVRMPCILVAFEPINGNSEVVALLRIGLDNTGTKVGRKFLGPVGGAVIKLDADEDVTHGLGLTEGLEKGMALRSRWQWRPIWVTGSAGKLAAFPVLPGVEALTIFADNDVPKRRADGSSFYPGQDAADMCADRWRLAGAEVSIWVPDQAGEDWHDVAVRA